MDLSEFQNLPLRGGFLLLRLSWSDGPIVDAMGRSAVARTTIIGSNLDIELGALNHDPDQLSISIYHEVLEAAAVAALHAPGKVCELNEAGFEAAALDCHRRIGRASAAGVNQMLAEYGF
jgi:hypothetical protein